jgi:hypothetical protein
MTVKHYYHPTMTTVLREFRNNIYPTNPTQRPSHILTELPCISNHFFGRSIELEKMYEMLDPNKDGRKGVVLQSISGSGKTQLALKYVDLHAKAYNHILWISAASEDEVETSFEKAARSIESADIPLSEKDSRLGVHAWLKSLDEPRWLIVLDSLDLLTLRTRQFLPKCDKGSVLITTTLADAKNYFELPHIELPDLDEESACDLIQALARWPRDPCGADEAAKGAFEVETNIAIIR